MTQKASQQRTIRPARRLLMSRRSPAPPVAHERARVASLTRSRTPDDPELLEARRTLRALTLEDHVARAVAAAPSLTDAQRSRIAALLSGGGAIA